MPPKSSCATSTPDSARFGGGDRPGVAKAFRRWSNVARAFNHDVEPWLFSVSSDRAREAHVAVQLPMLSGVRQLLAATSLSGRRSAPSQADSRAHVERPAAAPAVPTP